MKKKSFIKYPFKLHCMTCQKERQTIFYVYPELPGENFKYQCKCGNVLNIDDIEIVFTTETLKADTIQF